MPGSTTDTHKAYDKKRKSKHQDLCKFWAKGSCRKCNGCDFQHTGTPGRNNDWNKKKKKDNKHKTHAVFDKVAMQTMATIMAQAMTVAQHPPPAKGGAAAIQTLDCE